MPQPKQSDTPPANVKWLVAIIIGVLVVGTAVAILAARAAGLATAPGFFGTRASLLADINFSLEILLLLGLTFGFMLARRGNISAHQYNQTAWVLFNIVLVEFIMAVAFNKQVVPGIPDKLTRPYYWLSAAHSVIGGLTVFGGVYLLLRMNKLLPKVLRISWWKNLMRATLAGYWIVGLLGVGTYYVWYTAPAESTGAPAVAQTGNTVVVPVANYEYLPRDLNVPLGTTVVFVNQDASPHTVTWDDGSVDSGSFDQGEQFSFTFDAAGSFPYFCAFHGGPGGADMAGTITVGSAGEAAAVPTAVSVALAPTAAPTPENPPVIFFDSSAVAFGVFRDNGDALTNEFRFIGSNIPAPADGAVYELWLKRGSGQDTLGKIAPDANGNVFFAFKDPQGRNLLKLFDGFFVSIEAANDTDPAPSDQHLLDGSISSGARRCRTKTS
ncbi:MAG: cupredoxin domain-containing protein, partial [Chloroflexota bacterium]